MLTLGHIVAALSNYEVAGTEPPIAFVTNDSRQAAADSLFVAFDGEQVDGHNYVASAFERGATAAIVERALGDFAFVDVRSGSVLGSIAEQGPTLVVVENSEKALQQCARYWRQQHAVRVIGITGSVGKTSTKECAYSVMGQQYRTLKSEKNFNTEIGLPMQLLNLRPEHERVILEMGMYVRGDIALLASVGLPNVGIVTNVGEVHVERAGSKEAIALGKRELVEALPSDGVAILNRDDPNVWAMRDHTAARVLTYGTTPEADLWASDIATFGFDGIGFRLNHQGKSVAVRSPMRGKHNVYTALCAAAAGLVEGMDWNAIVRGLASHEDRLRLIRRPGINDSTIVDDAYNSNPQSSAAALDLLADVAGRKVAVLGDMLELGEHEAEGHATIGRKCAQIVDELITVGKLGKLIGDAAVEAGFSAENIHVTPDSGAAAAIAMNVIRPKDTVLVKGSLGAKMKVVVDAIVNRHSSI